MQRFANTNSDGFFTKVGMKITPYHAIAVELYALILKAPDRTDKTIHGFQLFAIYIHNFQVR
jgi:hypothetical protein